ncbi:MAG: hydrogenase expression/formation protein HypE [Devosia sp.]|nr:hydrogenase expression/formation protein HypE [Devosia sp.]
MSRAASPFPLTGAIEMVHGGGGRAMAELIAGLFRRHLGNPILDKGHDAAVLPAVRGRLAISTDGHVISPLEFPGGDIGALAVHGTLNDIAMAGARPICLSAAFVLEEGLALEELDRIVASLAAAARAAGVPVVTGDTKVVERGKGDGIFITTTAIGEVPDGVEIAPERARPGQAVLLSGNLGDHGVAVLSKRANLDFETDILSDSAALHGMVAAMLAVAPGIAVLRDPTRGGLSAALNEITRAAGVGIVIEEARIPVRPGVAAACELLGLDPLNVANEGKLICVCAEADADRLLGVMREHPLGRDAARIGQVVAEDAPFVRMRTRLGGLRMLDWLSGEQLPRIC